MQIVGANVEVVSWTCLLCGFVNRCFTVGWHQCWRCRERAQLVLNPPEVAPERKD